MSHEIELLSDGDGLVVLGPIAEVEAFLQAEGLAETSTSVPNLSKLLGSGASAAQTGAEMAAQSGRWVKLTSESAAAVKKYGLMDTKTPGISHAMIGKPGEVQQWVQVVKAPGSMLVNPAMLAGAAGIMSQLAMQQQMSEITAYLQRIDEKLDAVVRMQTNQVLARIDGVELVVREAMHVRKAVGRVSEVTWSKAQASTTVLMETQALALRQLADLADKMEQAEAFGDLAKVSDTAQAEVRKWLNVLARCCHLHDGVGVLELERVLDASPEELNRHRLGLRAAREDRTALIAQATQRLTSRMGVAAERANANVLLHPSRAPELVQSSNLVLAEVAEFRSVLAIETDAESAEARRWKEAAGDTWDKVRDTSNDGLGALKQLGSGALGQVGSAKDKLSGKLSGLRRRGSGDDAAG